MSSHDDVVGGTWKFNRASGEKRRMEERRKQRKIEKAHKRLLEEIFADELADNRRRREGGK